MIITNKNLLHIIMLIWLAPKVFFLHIDYQKYNESEDKQSEFFFLVSLYVCFSYLKKLMYALLIASAYFNCTV